MKAKRILCGVIGLMYAVCTAVVPVSAADNAIPAEEELAAAANAIPDEEEKLAAVAATTATEATTAAATTATTAATEAKTAEPTTIKDYIKSLDYDNDAVLAVINQSDKQTDTVYSIAPNGDMVATYREKQEDSLSSSSIGFIDIDNDDPNVFPGAMLKANQNLITGNPDPVLLPRGKAKMSINGAVMKPEASAASVEFVPDGNSDAENAIKQLYDGLDPSADFGATITCKIEQFNSKEQIKAKLNVSETFLGKSGLDISAAFKDNHSIYVAELSQVYYTLKVDTIKEVEKHFADSVTLEDVKENISADEPPVVVSSVTYGRKVLVFVDCSDSSMDLSAALNASFAGVDIKTDATYNSAYDKCSITMLAYGGTTKDAGKFISLNKDNFGKINDSFSDTTKFTKGAAMPISYTTTFVKDCTIATRHYVGETWKTVRTVTRHGIPIRLQMDSALKIKYSPVRAKIRAYGKCIDSITPNGQITLKKDEELITELEISDLSENVTYIPGCYAVSTLRFIVYYEDSNPYHTVAFPFTMLEVAPQSGLDANYTRSIDVNFEYSDWYGEAWTQVYSCRSSQYDHGNGDLDYLSISCKDNGQESYAIFLHGDLGHITSYEPGWRQSSEPWDLSGNTIITTPPVSTEPTTTTTTTATTTTVSENTTPAPSANDILTTAASEETTAVTTTTTAANTTPASSTNASQTTAATTTTIAATSETDKPDGWFASLKEFEEMALKDYEQKTGKRPASAEATMDWFGRVNVRLSNEVDGEKTVIATYTLDPETGIGENDNSDAVNLPQTGNNVPTAAAAAGAALLLAAGGFFAMMKSGILRRKKEQ